MKRKLNNYYLTIKTETDIYDFSQDAFNVYYFTKTNQEALDEILQETYLKFITEGKEIYITQEPNSNNDSNKRNEVIRLLRNLPKYTTIITKKEVDKIIYQIKKNEN